MVADYDDDAAAAVLAAGGGGRRGRSGGALQMTKARLTAGHPRGLEQYCGCC